MSAHPAYRDTCPHCGQTRTRWLPLETAPRDGRPILLAYFNDEGVWPSPCYGVGQYSYAMKNKWVWNYSILPTHWRPLPDDKPETSNFGHYAASNGRTFFLDGWGAGPFLIYAGGRWFRFEDSDRFGPHLIRKNGEIRRNPYPAERSPFWRAHQLWRQQGRRVADDGITCIWDDPRRTIQPKRARRNRRDNKRKHQ